ncbi:MAG: hypothetical protein HY902_17865 [Deltaproteobacteria bacterium]|nr:hypothetical protein [Deltaproteobacteria bacterium]
MRNGAYLGLVAVSLVAGCAAGGGTGRANTAQGPDGGGDASALVQLGAPPANLRVHHWATFTVFHAVAGQQYVPGVGRSEETLPPFVHGLAAPALGPPLAKVQTAGAFFDADTAGDAQVELRVPHGEVGADWPPLAQKWAGGAGAQPDQPAVWQLHVEPDTAKLAALPAVEPNSVWQSLRQAGAARVSALGQTAGSDDLLFYRALGDFVPPLRVTAKKQGGSQGYEGTLTNDGDEEIPRAWLLHLHEGGGLMQPLKSVPAHGSIVFSPTPKEMWPYYAAQVQSTLTAELQNAGLTPPEAAALVASFTHNWLKTYGLRILILAPKSWADAHLQTTVTPKPAAEVRVVLGRIELLTEQDEAAMLDQLKVAAQTNDSGILQALGFFAEPKARRAQLVATDPAVQALAAQLVSQAAKLQ